MVCTANTEDVKRFLNKTARGKEKIACGERMHQKDDHKQSNDLPHEGRCAMGSYLPCLICHTGRTEDQVAFLAEAKRPYKKLNLGWNLCTI